jgi:DNA (cytosine-5)-methyltransferase 1
VKPRALDLCCGGGGATRGLQLAGFDVTGVDVVASPRYCGDAFVQADALEVELAGYDFIWASPPCQAYSCSTLALRNEGKVYPDLLSSVRERLKAAAVPYAIENVVGAPLRSPTVLCGTMFGLPLLRHRLFETSFPIATLVPPCRHTGDEVPVYGHNVARPRDDRRRGGTGKGVTVAEQRVAMGIDWMSRDELSQAIPPVYAKFIGEHALAALEVAA